jgi:hypothetical protein
MYRKQLSFICLVVVWHFAMVGATFAGQIIYVDADRPGGNGTSWPSSYKRLQDALHRPPSSGDQIWVAEGTYNPDKDAVHPSGSKDRTATFQLINGVAIYGGFAGNETTLEQRNWITHKTILSGDINMPGYNTDNSYHVVTGSGTNLTAILDGFTITAGYADLDNSDHIGAGMYNNYGSPKVVNCKFTRNMAIHMGGGMYNGFSSSPIVNNCIFYGNTAGNWGGGIWDQTSSSSPILANCAFIGNSAGAGGGGMGNQQGSPSMTNCIFSGNSTNGEGGGMLNNEGSITLTNCTFSGNSASTGGGMNNYATRMTVTNCILWGNSDSGGMNESAQIYWFYEGYEPVVRFSCIQGLNTFAGNNNIGDDPQFQDADGADDVVGTEDDNLRLKCALPSPCIDAGNNGDVPSGVITDLDGKSRFFNCLYMPDSGSGAPPIVDMGAYEAQCALDYNDDIKWSQPPVEVNVGIINGWDEVSTLNGNCWECPTQCHGDADCSGYVDQTDSDIFTAAYGTHYGDPNYNPCADFDRNGDVNVADQQIMQSWWHTHPPANCPSARAIVADDWICLDDRPIKDIHWWGSFKGWTGSVPPSDKPGLFHIGIWTDVPKSSTNTFSHPGRMVWEKVCNCYTWSYAGYDLDPRGIDPNEACFKFDQLLSQDEWFYQNSNNGKGTVYWLNIAAIYDGNTPAHPWGWKTRPHFYNDDAVQITDINGGSWPPTIGSVWASGQPIEYPTGISWDMAFTLTANRKFSELLYWPPPSPPPPQPPWIPIQWPQGNLIDFDHSGVIDLMDFAILADAYLKEAQPWPEPNEPNTP